MLLGGRPRAAPTPLRLGRQRGNSRLREPARQRQSILAGFAALFPVRAPFARRPPPVRLAGRAAALALAFAAAPAFAQVSVSITSTPANGTHYVAGEAITTRLTIPSLNSGDVQNARMKLNIGGVERQAASTTGYAFRLTQVNFSYTVVAADLDTDGISIPANSIVGAGIWRTGGLTAINRSHGALGNQSSHRVFGSPVYISATSPAARPAAPARR